MSGGLSGKSQKKCRACGTTDARHFDSLSRNRCRTCKPARRASAARLTASPIQKPSRFSPAPERDAKRSPEHMAWIRTLPCLVRGCAGGAMHAHHVRTRNGGGMGLKPPDSATVPLCDRHHGEGHQTGWQTFEAKYRLDLRAEAGRLAGISPVLTGRPEPGVP